VDDQTRLTGKYDIVSPGPEKPRIPPPARIFVVEHIDKAPTAN
jgi:hypothetical protein